MRDLLLERSQILEELQLTTSNHFLKKLAADIGHLPLESTLSECDSVREHLKVELEGRKFYILHLDRVKYFDNPRLAGDKFKDNWPKANVELIEAGNCFALDRYTACVCHLMRSLEYALKSSERALNITPGTRSTWGEILQRIEGKKGGPGKPHSAAVPMSPEWSARADFYDACLSFFSSIKSWCRDKTFHVESLYDENSARQLFDCSTAVLSKISEHLSEV